MNILAIDPGSEQSGIVVIDEEYHPLWFGKVDNAVLLDTLLSELIKAYAPRKVVIEMISHYGSGMPAGKTVFDTCIAIGRFEQWLFDNTPIKVSDIETIKRKEYVAVLCDSPKAKDANVIQYLIDRFAPNAPNRGKGTKKSPSWFYGFHADIWQSYALSVFYLDELKKKGEI